MTPQQLAELWYKGSVGQRRWFARNLLKMTTTEQTQVWQILSHHGWKRPGDPLDFVPIAAQPHAKTKGTRVVWTDDEVEQIIETAWRIRKNHANVALTQLIVKAQSGLPENRRRNINAISQLKFLIEGLAKKDTHLEAAANEVEALRQRILDLPKVPTRQEVISSLSDSELRQLQDRVFEAVGEEVILEQYREFFTVMTPLADLLKPYTPATILEAMPIGDVAAYVAKQLFERVAQVGTVHKPIPKLPPTPKPNTHQDTPANRVRLPKITFVAGTEAQARVVMDKLRGQADLVHVCSGEFNIPKQQDAVVLWTKFLSHTMQEHVRSNIHTDTKLYFHPGGMKGLIRTIHEIIGTVNARLNG